MNNELETTNLTVLPMIAMRGMLVFPQMTLSFDVEREASVRAADAAASGMSPVPSKPAVARASMIRCMVVASVFSSQTIVPSFSTVMPSMQ